MPATGWHLPDTRHAEKSTAPTGERTMSWSLAARCSPPLPDRAHRGHCGNCRRWAIRWHRDLLSGPYRRHGPEAPCADTNEPSGLR
ncbi:DUF7221 family queuine tRNA-ribosyltransferase-like protein [Micromonospora ureilytica]|uniref:deazapurine DNA modification protein DpdA family protein n=1 Tax=Micromonospora ureilytica TaxID=709868 RepID=UPI003F6CBE4D